MPKYAGDPRWMESRFAGVCHHCLRPFAKGARIVWAPNGKRTFCDGDACGAQVMREFAAAAADEAFLSGGM